MESIENRGVWWVRVAIKGRCLGGEKMMSIEGRGHVSVEGTWRGRVKIE